MLPRSHHWPEGHWDWLIHLSHKHGIRCGELIFVGGQVDKDQKGLMLNGYDLEAQTDVVMGHIATVLAGLDAGMADVVKLVAFYVDTGEADEAALLARIGRHVDFDPGPVITMVPLPGLAYPGMMVEIEAVAMLGADGAHLPRTASRPAGLPPLPGPFSRGIRCGEMIFVGAQAAPNTAGDLLEQTAAAMAGLGAVLAEFGAGLDDAVKLNIFFESPGGGEHWRDAALLRGGYFTEPGPVATGLPLPRMPGGELTRIEAMAMLGTDGAHLPREHVWPEGHWDWFVHLPYKHGLKCGSLVFVGGQVSKDEKGVMVDPGDLVAQTHTVMDNLATVLAGFGLGLDDVVKQNAFYKGAAHPTAIVENQRIRSARYREPACASTGVPLPTLNLEGMGIEIEVIAMT